MTRFTLHNAENRVIYQYINSKSLWKLRIHDRDTASRAHAKLYVTIAFTRTNTLSLDTMSVKNPMLKAQRALCMQQTQKLKYQYSIPCCNTIYSLLYYTIFVVATQYYCLYFLIQRAIMHWHVYIWACWQSHICHIFRENTLVLLNTRIYEK